jgi:hypothetical protein
VSWQDVLDADTLREIFERDIAPTLSLGGALALRPAVVFVGAQPGAGKSRAISAVRADHPDAVPVIGDDFRAFHPDYRDLMRSDPLSMPAVTAQAAGAWVGMAAAHLRQERRSVILETTMRQHAVVEQTAQAFRGTGYRVEIRALAVPGAVSLLGTVSRFLGAGTDRNRWTPSAAHDAAYTAMPATVEQLVAGGTVNQVTVITRSQRTLYHRTLTPDTAADAGAEVRRAIDDGRHPAELTPREGHDWAREFVSAAARIAHMRDVADDMRATMRRLASDAPEIIRATYKPAQQASAMTVVRAAAARTNLPRHRPEANTDTGPLPGAFRPRGGPTLN